MMEASPDWAATEHVAPLNRLHLCSVGTAKPQVDRLAALQRWAHKIYFSPN